MLLAAFGLIACSAPTVDLPENRSQLIGSDSSEQPAYTQPPANAQSLAIGEQQFFVEVVSTAATRQQGLMNRDFMPANQGMLFEFPNEAPRNFWMKNTLIPLDMIWLDANKMIVDIQAAEPCKVEQCPIYSGKAPAQYVLELNQGVLRGQVGDTVQF